MCPSPGRRSPSRTAPTCRPPWPPEWTIWRCPSSNAPGTSKRCGASWRGSTAEDIPLIAKIERPEALENLDDILRVSDGVMVARGDLGVETSSERVPIVQKWVIRQANSRGKIAITATQMLDSMISHPMPTRAEASDVANAILDGSDAVMLSGETSVGQYPIEAVRTLDPPRQLHRTARRLR